MLFKNLLVVINMFPDLTDDALKIVLRKMAKVALFILIY